MPLSISIIICSVDDGKFAAVMESFRAVLGGCEVEVLRANRAASLASTYNLLAARARGETLIFCHDDIEILSPDFAAVLQRAMATFDVVGVAGTSRLVGPGWIGAAHPYIFGQVVTPCDPPGLPYQLQVYGVPAREIGGIQALDGLFLTVRRGVLAHVQFDADLFDGFHLYDIDFTYRCHLLGLKVGVVCDLHLLHRSGGSFDETWRKYAERFIGKFPDWEWTSPSPEFQYTVLGLPDRQRLREVMTPSFWPALPSHE